MAVQKSKKSRSRSGMRRAHQSMSAPLWQRMRHQVLFTVVIILLRTVITVAGKFSLKTKLKQKKANLLDFCDHLSGCDGG